MSVKINNSLIIKIKVLIFTLSTIPLCRLIYLGLNDGLGANPIEFLERSTGTWSLVFLMLSLTITPIRQWSGINNFIQFRRMLGLFMFFMPACISLAMYGWITGSI